MKKSTRWTAFASALAVTGLLVSASVAATGDENDPLITLSYLERVAIPEVVSQVEDNMALRQKELEKAFGEQVGQYKIEMEKALGSSQQVSASYELVTLTGGQTMSLDVGCELMLRVGSAKVSSGTNPALIDVSTGGSVNSGTALTKNHLYMSTIPDRTLTAGAGTVKLLVRGGYTIA